MSAVAEKWVTTAKTKKIAPIAGHDLTPNPSARAAAMKPRASAGNSRGKFKIVLVSRKTKTAIKS
jgi:hypothetical protein